MIDGTGSVMPCPSPIDALTLADYWAGLLPSSEEEHVEEHMLSCDSCGQRLRDVIAMAGAIKELAREGSLRMIVSETFLKRAAESGSRVRRYVLPPGGSVQCTVTEDDDLLIGQVTADLTGAGRIDICICDERGVEQMRLPDIPVNADTGSIIYQESITFAKAGPTMTMKMRLVSVDENGADHPISEFTFNHTRSMPGPGEP
jgi:hypothetical protein